jgi:uncharacterized repeat protein (TIGR01451 family)
MLRLTTFFLLFICFSGMAQAQFTWQPLNRPSGTNNLEIRTVDQTGRIFATVGKDVWTSTDNGTSWINSSNGISTSFSYNINQFLTLPTGKVVLGNQNNYYPSDFYKYNAATNSWSGDNSFAPESGLLSLDNQQRVWSVLDEDIYLSINQGASFTKILTGDQTEGWHDLMANYNDDHNLVAVSYGTDGKLYHFKTDGTLALSQSYSGVILYLGYSPYSGTAFYSTYQESYRSSDGGLTWEQLTIPGFPGPGYAGSLNKVFFESATRIWASIDGAAYVSDDDGINWSKAPALDITSGQFYRTPNGTFFSNVSCSDASFIRSTDEGANWTDLTDNFHYPYITSLQGLNNGPLYAGNCSLYNRSVDGGQTWSKAIIQDSTTFRMNNLAVLPDGDLFTIGPNFKLLHSTDGGVTWNKVVNAPTLNNYPFTPGYFIKTDLYGNLYFSGTQNLIYKSSDKGLTWHSTLGYYYLDPNTNGFHVLPNGDIIAFWSGDNSFTHYSAAADTSSYESVTIPGVDYPQIDIGITTAQGDLLIVFSSFSQNGSSVARYLGNGQFERVNAFPGIAPTLFASSEFGLTYLLSQDTIYQSDDSGHSWTFACQIPVSPNDNYPSGFWIGQDRHLYLSYQNPAVFRSVEAIPARNLITGTAWMDLNGNCLREPNEPVLNDVYVKASGSADYGGYSWSTGAYKVYATAGNYQLAAQPPSPLFESLCPVSITVASTHDTVHQDVALHPIALCPYLEVNASVPFLRRCFHNSYAIEYSNKGTAAATGAYVQVVLDSFFIYQSSSIPLSSQNGQTLTFQVGDIAPGDHKQFSIEIKISCEAPLHQEHCLTARIFPGDPCLPGLPDLSSYTECRQNIGAFDPNAKHAFVDGKEDPGTVLANKTIEYLLAFQNTGTDTAFNVIVEDRLPAGLDISTVKPLVSSHPFSFELAPDRNLRFTFSHILLPDSNLNEAASHGFVKFSVQQMPDLPVGTVINNQARIFFDFNAPVPTNNSHLIITAPLKVKEPIAGYEVQVYPNPFADAVTFKVKSPEPGGIYNLLLTDALGRTVARSRFTGETFLLERNDMETGAYFFSISTDSGQRIATGRVLVE